MSQQWLTIIIVLLIIIIVIDGIRRMRNARRDSIKMSLKARPPVEDLEVDELEEKGYGSEFPNGGARPSDRQIDPERIKEVRRKYNFGDDMPKWRQHLEEAVSQKPAEKKIEPSLNDADPLLDEPSQEIERAPVKTSKSVSEKEIMPSRSSETEKPVQVSLNLEDSVPMLMDTLEEVAQANREKETSEDTKLSNTEVEIEVDTSPKDQPEPIQAVAKAIESGKENNQDLKTHSANKPRYESKYTDHAQAQAVQPEEVLVVHLRAREDDFFQGSELLEIVLDSGLRFGAMDIFHYHADDEGEGPILFSMANMVKPGNFDLHSFEEFTTIGLSFFISLPVATGEHMAAFERLLATAKRFKDGVGGELKDENRSVLTGQTIEHYRERIRDFSRRQQLEKNKS